MNNDIIVAQVKEDMKTLVEAVQLDNFTDIQDRLKKYFSFLESLCQLETPQTLLSLEKEELEKEKTVSDPTPTSQIEEQEAVTEENVHIFERKLRGGFIKEVQAFVPEGVVRKLGLEHGDQVKVKEDFHASTNPDENKKHYFELYKKGQGIDQEGRVQLNYCMIEKDGSMIVVKKYLNNGWQDIRIDEVPYSILIRNEDIQEFGLKEGDLVDLSYMEDSPNFCKVIWKHVNESDVEYETETSSFPTKKKKKESTIVKDILEEEQTLEGKTVLVVGCEPRKAVFKDSVEKRGGEFLWAEGTEERSRLESLIRKSDVVTILIRFIRHRASKMAVEICKQYDVPFAIVENLGIQTMIQETSDKVVSA